MPLEVLGPVTTWLRTDLECQYEQNWSSLLSVPSTSTSMALASQATPQLSESDSGCRALDRDLGLLLVLAMGVSCSLKLVVLLGELFNVE